MQQPDCLDDYQYLSQLQKENGALERKLEQLCQEWESIGLQLEEDGR